jgi:hypothetical protein
MKRTIVTLIAGLLIGGATLGPLTAGAAGNATLHQRVRHLESRVERLSDISCELIESPLDEPSWCS